MLALDFIMRRGGGGVRTCGETVSNISLAIGIPNSVNCTNSCLEILKPLLIWKLSSISGSLINPFQPTVVLGFSR